MARHLAHVEDDGDAARARERLKRVADVLIDRLGQVLHALFERLLSVLLLALDLDLQLLDLFGLGGERLLVGDRLGVVDLLDQRVVARLKLLDFVAARLELALDDLEGGDQALDALLRVAEGVRVNDGELALGDGGCALRRGRLCRGR